MARPNCYVLYNFIGIDMSVNKGFTLIEIMVALTIAAVGIAGIVHATGSSISVTQAIEERLVATWVASNQLATLRMARQLPSAQESTLQPLRMGGREWYLKQKVKGTADKNLVRVEVEVYSDQNLARLAGKLTSYVGRYVPPSAAPPEPLVPPGPPALPEPVAPNSKPGDAEPEAGQAANDQPS